MKELVRKLRIYEREYRNGTLGRMIEETEEVLKEAADAIEMLLAKLEARDQNGEWILFKEREADDEEREVYGCYAMLDCKLPDEDEDILVTYASGRVGFDTFLTEGYECYLDSGAQFISEAIAWMPLPEPYKEDMRGGLND